MSDATLRVYYLRLRTLKFQSTHRVSDATIFDIFGSGNSKFQSTHRVSDATSSQRYQVYNPHISIHAPRERCDEVPATHRNVNTTLISIHAPRERCDMTLIAIFCKAFSISIHAPRERCDVKNPKITKLSTGISIHAPRERCDAGLSMIAQLLMISIHAPRERCDAFLIRQSRIHCDYFNPRTA